MPGETASDAPKPVAFMVMPFGKKNVDREHADAGAPATVDFDALWERVYEPALEDLGYDPVRADQDVGALIINEMICRLTIADLVVADVSLPNANVYYELGIRHAARACGCVTVAADWARPLFDIAPQRRLTFPLSDGTVPPEQADTARKVLLDNLGPLTEGMSPVYEAVSGYPDHIAPSVMSAFRSTVAELSAFDAAVRAVHLLPASQRAARAREMVRLYHPSPAVSDAVAMRLLDLLHETAQNADDWAFELEFIPTLSPRLAREATVLERRALALGKHGDTLNSASELQQLIDTHGGTSERYGLLGGRYKRLMGDTTAGTIEHRLYLNRAIESYEKGMQCDLNDYYPASNLPRLYRERGREQDLLRAADVSVIAAEACRRALALGLANDYWLKATLLGLAFYRGDVHEAQRLCECVIEAGPGAWQLRITLEDLIRDIEHQPDPTIRAQLTAVKDDLAQLLTINPVT
jgi:hypothetical protein